MADGQEHSGEQEQQKVDAHKVLNEKHEDANKKLQDAFDERAAQGETDEIALATLRETLPKKLKDEVLKKIYDKYRERLENASISQRQNLMGQLSPYDKILEEADAEAQNFIDTITIVINLEAQKGGDKKKLEVNEIAELSKILEDVNALMKGDKQFQQILKKMDPEALDKKQLTPSDYQKAAEMWLSGGQNALNAPKGNEAKINQTNARILVKLMDSQQRMDFVREMMDSQQAEVKAKAVDAIDELLKNNQITLRQGELLFSEAFNKGLIDSDQLVTFQKDLQAKYPHLQEQFKADEEKAIEALRGQYSNNVFNRGTQLIGMIMGAHGVLWFAGNLLASGGDFNRILQNPYLAFSGLEILTGRYISKYGGKIGTSYAGLGPLFEYFTDSDKPENPEQEEAIIKLGEIYSDHLDFGNYLKNGGAQAIIDLNNDHALNQNHAPVTYDDLIEKARNNHDQKMSLEAAQKFGGGDIAGKIEVEKLIVEFIKISQTLEISNQPIFDHKIELIEKGQGLKGRKPIIEPEPTNPEVVEQDPNAPKAA